MEFFIIIVCGGLLFHLFNRVSKLETEVKSLKEGKSFSASVPSAVPPSALSQNLSTPTPTNTPNPIPQTIAPTQPKTSMSQGQLLGKIGIIAILLGVSFFLKYAFDNNLIGEAGRVIIGLIAGLAFLGVGQVLRPKYGAYADFILAGGIGILYLTIYASFGWYHQISAPVAYAFMMLVTACAITLSLIGGTVQLAYFGTLGGFLTPILISTGSSSLLGLSIYMAILDVGVLLVAMFKRWMKLEYLAFAGTALLYIGWFNQFYRDTYFMEVFLTGTFFWFLFVCISGTHHLVRKEKTEQDYMVFSVVNAFAYGLLMYIVVEPLYKDYLGFFSLLIGVFYLIFAMLSLQTNKENTLCFAVLAGLASFFVTVAVPLQFSIHWVPFIWTVEAAILFGLYHLSRFEAVRAFAFMVYVAGVVSYVSHYYIGLFGNFDAEIPFLNARFIAGLLFVLVLYLASFIEHKVSGATEVGKKNLAILLVLAQIGTLAIGTGEISMIGQNAKRAEQNLYNATYQQKSAYLGQNFYNSPESQSMAARHYAELERIRNTENTAVIIFWILYAVLLLVVGIRFKNRSISTLSFILFLLSGAYIVIVVWNLGIAYRIVSFIVFGVLALFGSFLYTKFKDRLA